MSAAFAPKLEVPSIETVNITITEVNLSQPDSPDMSFLPHSVTISSDVQAEVARREPMFGTHMREAFAIFKDWLGG